ncbi:MAG: hypothetical protein F4029_17475 [Gammaproteobacteria bacterium]|nr:hypothetical protein [Gammaproteobacteria bacterium]MYF29581.1 hypothetical protein [Gammaproteobacteria bacterium]MYK48009.1 hypothetical protein [Gammaproteobacteria bacterium]
MTERNSYSKWSEVRPAVPSAAGTAADNEDSSDYASRVEKLLAYDDPGSPEYVMARFAAETVAAEVPVATLEEHEALMEARLQDALLAQEAAEDLGMTDTAIRAQAEAAASALREGRFNDADSALSVAEHSGVGNATQARVRSVRAEAALVRSDVVGAAEHYIAAAGSLRALETDPESQEETMLFRSRAVARLIRHADTFGGDGGWIDGAMELCNANIRYQKTHVWNQGARQMDAGSAQLSAGRLKAEREALDLFLGAEHSFRIASWHFDEGGFPRDWAAAQNGRGLAQAHFCFRYKEATGKPPPEESWAAAEDCYRAAMDVHMDARPMQWAKTRINLGYLLLHRAGGSREAKLGRTGCDGLLKIAAAPRKL